MQAFRRNPRRVFFRLRRRYRQAPHALSCPRAYARRIHRRRVCPPPQRQAAAVPRQAREHIRGPADIRWSRRRSQESRAVRAERRSCARPHGAYQNGAGSEARRMPSACPRSNSANGAPRRQECGIFQPVRVPRLYFLPTPRRAKDVRSARRGGARGYQALRSAYADF